MFVLANRHAITSATTTVLLAGCTIASSTPSPYAPPAATRQLSGATTTGSSYVLYWKPSTINVKYEKTRYATLYSQGAKPYFVDYCASGPITVRVAHGQEKKGIWRFKASVTAYLFYQNYSCNVVAGKSWSAGPGEPRCQYLELDFLRFPHRRVWITPVPGRPAPQSPHFGSDLVRNAGSVSARWSFLCRLRANIAVEGAHSVG
jgi:hypothetical protein